MSPKQSVEMQRPISPQDKPYHQLPSTSHLTSPTNLPVHYIDPYDVTNSPEYLPQPKTAVKTKHNFEKPNTTPLAGRRRQAPTRLIVDPKQKTHKQY